MKSNKLPLIILLAFLAIVSYQCTNQGDKDKATENGKSEQQTKPARKEKPKITKDERGNIIERQSNSYRKSDGSLRTRESYYYDYDDSNNVVKEIKESYNLDGSRKYKNVNYYKYDSRNLKIDLVFETFDENDEMIRTAHHSYNYNKRGDKIEDIGYAEDGRVISRIILSPNETGLLLSEEYIYYDEKGEIIDHKKYYYTEYGLERSEDLMKKK